MFFRNFAAFLGTKDIVGSTLPITTRTKEPNCNKSVDASCAGVSMVAMACGEPEVRRNGLRISLEIIKQ